MEEFDDIIMNGLSLVPSPLKRSISQYEESDTAVDFAYDDESSQIPFSSHKNNNDDVTNNNASEHNFKAFFSENDSTQAQICDDKLLKCNPDDQRPITPIQTWASPNSTSPITPTANLKMLMSAVSPELRNRELRKEINLVNENTADEDLFKEAENGLKLFTDDQSTLSDDDVTQQPAASTTKSKHTGKKCSKNLRLDDKQQPKSNLKKSTKNYSKNTQLDIPFEMNKIILRKSNGSKKVKSKKPNHKHNLLQDFENEKSDSLIDHYLLKELNSNEEESEKNSGEEGKFEEEERFFSSQEVECTGQSHVSRKEKSLGLLCHKFISKYPLYPDTSEPLFVCLDVVAKELGVERRRIYDIVNVLESLEIMCRAAKNRYLWYGKVHLQATLNKMKAFAEANGFSTVVDDFREYEIMSDIEARLASSSDIDTPLTEARAVAPTICLKAKIRRLYDIANVFTSLELICKVHITEGRGRKPAFKYIGPPLDTAGDVTYTFTESNSRHSLVDSVGSHTGLTRHASFDKICAVAERERTRLAMSLPSLPPTASKDDFHLASAAKPRPKTSLPNKQRFILMSNGGKCELKPLKIPEGDVNRAKVIYLTRPVMKSLINSNGVLTPVSNGKIISGKLVDASTQSSPSTQSNIVNNTKLDLVNSEKINHLPAVLLKSANENTPGLNTDNDEVKIRKALAKRILDDSGYDSDAKRRSDDQSPVSDETETETTDAEVAALSQRGIKRKFDDRRALHLEPEFRESPSLTQLPKVRRVRKDLTSDLDLASPLPVDDRNTAVDKANDDEIDEKIDEKGTNTNEFDAIVSDLIRLNEDHCCTSGDSIADSVVENSSETKDCEPNDDIPRNTVTPQSFISPNSSRMLLNAPLHSLQNQLVHLSSHNFIQIPHPSCQSSQSNQSEVFIAPTMYPMMPSPTVRNFSAIKLVSQSPQPMKLVQQSPQPIQYIHSPQPMKCIPPSPQPINVMVQLPFSPPLTPTMDHSFNLPASPNANLPCVNFSSVNFVSSAQIGSSANFALFPLQK